MSRPRKPPPVAWLEPEGTWPYGPFTPDTPGYIRTAAGFAARIRDHLTTTGTTPTQLARDAGIDPGTLSRLLAGANLPDHHTMHALETTIGIPLWTPLNPYSPTDV